MNSQKTLFTTSRTTIHPISEKDISQILEMYQEPDSFKFIAPHKDKTNDYYRKFLEGKIESNKPEVGFWTVYNKATNDLVGTVNLNQFMDTTKTHIGCHLSRKHWNKGYALELMTALIDYGFSERNLTEIYAGIEVSHTVSIKLFEKLHFQLEDRKTINGSDLYFYKKFNHLSI